MSDSYNAARSKLRQAEETSALETDMDEVNERHCRRKRLKFSSSESEPSPEKMTKKARVKPHTKSKKALLPLPQVPPTSTPGEYAHFPT